MQSPPLCPHHAEPPFVSPPCRALLGVSPCRLQGLTTGCPHHPEPLLSPPCRASLGVPTTQTLTGCLHHAEPYRVPPPCRTSLGVPAVQSPAGCTHHEEPHWVSLPCRAPLGVPTVKAIFKFEISCRVKSGTRKIVRMKISRHSTLKYLRARGCIST